MRTALQYNVSPEVYYAKLWKVSPKIIQTFIKVYNLNRKVWRYKQFKEWFWLSYKFRLTYKRFYKFVRYYKIYKRRQLLRLPPTVKITSDFIYEALQSDW